MALTNLAHRCVQIYHQKTNDTLGGKRNRRNNNNNPQTAIINALHQESLELKRCLLLTYTGARLRKTFDWTLSNIEDDVSEYTQKLTEMESQLFQISAAASHAHAMWKLYGSRRIHVSEMALRSSVLSTSTIGRRQSNRNSNDKNTPGPGGGDSAGMKRNNQSRFVSPDVRGRESSKKQRTY
mmetsp:Transcript_15139/g.18444  ORF Transcript_15139/g.18444 Transcript_15139/m.18444 type:complete len:182 (+) Transcript_15139:45-590(+)